MNSIMRRALKLVGYSPRIHFPETTVWEKLRKARKYTPDLVPLTQSPFHYLFVCGEMQHGHHQQHMLWAERDRFNIWSHNQFEAFTQVPMQMLLNDLGVMSHPLVFDEEVRITRAILKLPVKGEIIKVRPYAFLDLDKYYSNGVRFVRKPVLLVVPFTHVDFKDRRIAENLFGSNEVKIQSRNKEIITVERGPLGLQSSTVKKRGVIRVWAMTYFAVPDYWFDLLSEYNNPVTQSFDNPNGLIKNYYRFTIEQYDPVPF